jgi:beta-galactosidase
MAMGPGSRVIPFGTGWKFGPAVEGSNRPGFDDSGWAAVTLPHTVVPLSWQDWDPAAWERVWVYRKHFDAWPEADVAGRRVFLDVGAALTHSTVTLNGTEVGGYLGGYLPFAVELTGLAEPSGNVLAVRLDSTFNLNVPPDRPAPAVTTSVDFWQPGGIYRDVRLRVVPQAFLADVFAKPVNVLDAAARQVEVQVTVDAAAALEGKAEVAVSLRDDELVIAAGQVPVVISGPGQTTVTVTLTALGEITLWDLDAVPRGGGAAGGRGPAGRAPGPDRVPRGHVCPGRVLPERPPGEIARGQPAPVLPVRRGRDARPGPGQGRRDHPAGAELHHGALFALPTVGGLLRRL